MDKNLCVVYPFGKLKLTGGVDLRTAGADYSSTSVYPAFPPFPPTVSSNKQSHDSVHHRQVGIFTALNTNLANGFNLEAGGRMNLHSEYGSHYAFNVNPSVLLKSSIKVFANASSGFKTPSLYQLYGDIFGNPDLDPETSINIEGGLQVFTKNGVGNIRATYFSRKVEDVIIFFYNPTTFTGGYINQDKQKDHGYELDAVFKPSSSVTIKLFYSHVDGEVTSKLANGKDTTFSNLIRRPENTMNIYLGYQVTPRLFLSTQLQKIGKSRDYYYDPATFTSKEVTLDDYFLIHLYSEFGFSQNRLKVFADLRDVTDKRYTEIYGYGTPGFQWYAGLKLSF